MTSYEDIADLPYAPSESDLKDPDYAGEPSAEWDIENFAAATSNLRNGAGPYTDVDDDSLGLDLRCRYEAAKYVETGDTFILSGESV